MNKLKFYTLCYPPHENKKKNAILGHVNFFQNSLDIINKDIFHYLISKKIKEDIHLNN